MPHDDDDAENFPIAYSIDNAILMHRDVHFGGSFPLMLEYYRSEGKGISNDFDLSRIEELYAMEQKTGKDISPLLLSGAEAEKIGKGRHAYKLLRDLYAVRKSQSPIPRLIADLILAEEADIPSAVQAVVAQKSAIVPALIDLLRNEEFYDPLFPGYGQAPALAAECLGKIGDKRAIISLFEAISEGDFFSEDTILDALHAIGEPAKIFLLRVLHATPITMDNEQAAIALIRFKSDPKVGTACLNFLQGLDLSKHLALATYLVLACEGIASNDEQQALFTIAEKPTTPKSIRQDIAIIAKTWL